MLCTVEVIPVDTGINLSVKHLLLWQTTTIHVLFTEVVVYENRWQYQLLGYTLEKRKQY